MISVPFVRPADATAGGFDLVTVNAAPPPAFALLLIADPAQKIEKAAAVVIRVLIILSSLHEWPQLLGALAVRG